MSAPRPSVTDPFLSRDSIYVNKQFLHIYGSVPYISSMWYIEVCPGAVLIRKLRMRSCRNTLLFCPKYSVFVDI